MLSVKTTTVHAKAAGARRTSRATRLVVVAAKSKLDNQGFVNNDNSGRSNIFPTSQKAFYSSPTSSAAASQGLGGTQGLGVVAGVIAVVAVVTVAVAGGGGSGGVVEAPDALDSLTSIAARIADSL